MDSPAELREKLSGPLLFQKLTQHEQEAVTLQRDDDEDAAWNSSVSLREPVPCSSRCSGNAEVFATSSGEMLSIKKAACSVAPCAAPVATECRCRYSSTIKELAATACVGIMQAPAPSSGQLSKLQDPPHEDQTSLREPFPWQCFDNHQQFVTVSCIQEVGYNDEKSEIICNCNHAV